MTLVAIKPAYLDKPAVCAFLSLKESTIDELVRQTTTFVEGGVGYNNFKFCHACGKPVEVATTTEGSQQ